MRKIGETPMKLTFIPRPDVPPPRQSETVPVSIAEYQNLVACRVILDMILNDISSDGSVCEGITKAAHDIRGLYL